jgi:hypothetical protein
MGMRIPEDTVTSEEFTAIRVRLRMFFGVPAEVIPETYEELCDALGGGARNSKLYPWLHTHGYEVVQDVDQLRYLYFVIRPEAWTGASVVSDKIRDAIDREVLNALLGKEVT